MKRTFLLSMFLLGCFLPLEAITISGYDVFNGQPSGFGNWKHVYNGSITGNPDGTVNEVGGSGTLNDGVLPTSTDNTYLFSTSNDTQIVLHFDQAIQVSSIALHNFCCNNSIPGKLAQLTVTIDGVSEVYSTSAFGPVGASNLPVNELVNISNTQQALASNQIILSNFASSSGSNYSFGEIVIDGNDNPDIVNSAVPEPSSYLLGLLAIVFWAVRSKKS